MKKSLKTLFAISIFFAMSLGLSIQPLFAFNAKDSELINQILIKQEIQNQKIENIESSKSIYEDSIKSSIEALDIKNEGIDFKSNYYDTALTLLTIFGGLVLAVAIVLGFYKKGEINDARKEIREDFNIIKNDFTELKKEAREQLNKEIKEIHEEKAKLLSDMDLKFKNELLSVRIRMAGSIEKEQENNEEINLGGNTDKIDFE